MEREGAGYVENIGRRQLLQLGWTAAGAGLVATACDRLDTEPRARDTASGRGKDGALEAPMLAERVRAGELPPRDQRLPDRPLVVEPIDGDAAYGGEWQMAVTGPPGAHWLLRTIGYEHLVRWRPGVVDFSANDVLPNLAEGVEVNADATVYEFALRSGVKWSDGAPFTADDIVFAFEDVLTHSDPGLPALPLWMTTDGAPPKLIKVDDHTIRFQFERTNSLFLQRLATPDGNVLTSYPAHYLTDVHAAYGDDIEARAHEEGLDGWADFFLSRSDLWSHEGHLPTLNAWHLTTSLTGTAQQVVAERNPYYWKVDTDGRQLPYIDRVVFSVIAEPEVIVLRMSNGELDLMDPFETELQDKPVLARGRSSGDYDFVDTFPSWMNTMMIALNLASEDPAKREVFNNRDFRIGLSHGINRDEIIDVVYRRQGEAWQAAPRPESKFYDEEMAKQYTNFDPAAANRHLDLVLPEKDARGRRLGPDGEVFSFAVDVATSLRPDWVEALELIKGHWSAVGIDMRINGIDRSLFSERGNANLHDASVWYGDGGLEVVLEPRWYFPFSSWSLYATPWALWFADPATEGALEPPTAAKRQMELYRELLATPGPDPQDNLMREILEIAKAEFWAIGISILPEMYAVMSNRLRNTPTNLLNAWLFATPGPTNPAQYAIRD